MDVGELELLQDVLRGVALRRAGRGRRWCGPDRSRVDIFGLHHRGDLDARHPLEGRPDRAVVDAQLHHGRAHDREVLQASIVRPPRPATAARSRSMASVRTCTTTRSLRKRLGERRNINDATLEAGRQILAAGHRRQGRLRLGRHPRAALGDVDHRRRAERGELEGAGEVDDLLRLLRRQPLAQLRRERQRLEYRRVDAVEGVAPGEGSKPVFTNTQVDRRSRR